MCYITHGVLYQILKHLTLRTLNTIIFIINKCEIKEFSVLRVKKHGFINALTMLSTLEQELSIDALPSADIFRSLWVTYGKQL
jgi:hypothetical protein